MAQDTQEQTNNDLTNDQPEAELVKIDEVTTEVVSEPLEFIE